MRRRINIKECKRCWTILSPSGSCPNQNCSAYKEEMEELKKLKNRK